MFMLRTEYGGMNEVLANLYGLTRQAALPRHWPTSSSSRTFLDPLAAHRDDLRGLHANTHVPKVIGAARMYELTGDTRYRDIAHYFLDEVLDRALLRHRQHAASASTGARDPGNLKGSLQYHNAECCVAYNLMKLERSVFAWTGDARWMDAYERQLWNCRLGTQNPQGLKQYFFPLAAGYWRYYNSAEESFWCCTGTGAEEFAKFNDTIYFHSAAHAATSGSTSSSPPSWIGRSRIRPRARRPPSRQSREPPCASTLKLRSAAPSICASPPGSPTVARSRSTVANSKPSASPAAISPSPASGATATTSSYRSPCSFTPSRCPAIPPLQPHSMARSSSPPTSAPVQPMARSRSVSAVARRPATGNSVRAAASARRTRRRHLRLARSCLAQRPHLQVIRRCLTPGQAHVPHYRREVRRLLGNEGVRPDRTAVIKTISSREVYRNKWTSVREDVIERANGERGIYGVVDKDPACIVIPHRTEPPMATSSTSSSSFATPSARRFKELPQGGWEAARRRPRRPWPAANCARRPASPPTA